MRTRSVNTGMSGDRWNASHCIDPNKPCTARRDLLHRQELFYQLNERSQNRLSTARMTDDYVALKNDKAIKLALYKPEHKEALIAMYASMSPEAIRWGLPPYDRARIERWTSDLANSITLLARLDERVVGHLQMFRIPFERRKGVAELFIYIHQDFQNR